MGEWFSQQAASGSLLLAIPVALVAGLVSFFSPCVVPLLPGYLSYATGLSGADLQDSTLMRRQRPRMLAGSLLFVLGFTVIFVLIGVASGALGAALVRWQHEVSVVLGALSIALGLVFLGLVPFAQRDLRIHSVPAVGLAAAPVLGFLFGLGWTPCVGPTLGVITTLSLNEGTVARGALLSAVFAFGLGLPFILAGVAYERMLGAFAVIRRHQAWVTRIGGLMMIGVGLLLVTGWWAEMTTWVQVHLVQGFQVGV